MAVPDRGARTAPPTTDDTGETTCAAELKARLAQELAQLARDMATFQTTLSALLEGEPMSPDHVRRLQDLDRATQMLDNLHRLAQALAVSHPHPVTTGHLEALITLDDLRRRLAGVPSGRAEANEDGVAWL